MLEARVFAIPRRMFTSGCASSSPTNAIESVIGIFAGTGAVFGALSVALAIGIVIASVAGFALSTAGAA